MVAGIPLALGSWLGLLVLAATVPALIWRIHDEEKMLKKDLPGYGDYLQKVHYRLVPYLWYSVVAFLSIRPGCAP